MTAREISADEVEGLRCFLCCDVSVLVPSEFAADMDAKVLGRSDSLEGSAMEVVLGLYWSSFPCKGDGRSLTATAASSSTDRQTRCCCCCVTSLAAALAHSAHTSTRAWVTSSPRPTTACRAISRTCSIARVT